MLCCDVLEKEKVEEMKDHVSPCSLSRCEVYVLLVIRFSILYYRQLLINERDTRQRVSTD
jgi:hypothetical protein